MAEDKIAVTEMLPDANKEGLHRYLLSGLTNYWLAPELFEENEAGDLRLFQLDNVHAAIGMHICGLERPAGPREVKFLRSEMEFSQTEMGHALGYKDRQPILKAERLGENRDPLTPTADLLLRNVYLGWLGKHSLVGEAYRVAALKLSEALISPAHSVDEMDYRIAA